MTMRKIDMMLTALLLALAMQAGADEPNVTRSFVFQGAGENALACGPVLTVAPNGDWLCAWLGGGRAEPAPENGAVVTRSADGGKTWSTPAVVLPRPGTILELYCVGARVWALGFEYDADSNYTVKRPCRMFSDDNGTTWSAPEYLQTTRQNVAIESHVLLANGEWLSPAYFMEPRAEPLPGGTRREYTHTIGCCVAISKDEGATFETNDEGRVVLHGSIDNRPLGLHEPRLVQLGSGRVLMLMRANFDGHLWQAHSDDNGRTWSEATQMSIPNPSAKVWVGQIGDGRIGLALNPSEKRRDPLELWVSSDDAQTWPVHVALDRYENYTALTAPGERHDAGPGWGKGGAWPGNLSYPFAMLRDGTLHIVYDVARRDVVMANIRVHAIPQN
ncbi:MAG: glycoside hydrolase [Candidatus Hydrogenedentes bacterium]|nr:glycoside hydrolase [Candidatus Hydrogenedentota bacterium]